MAVVHEKHARERQVRERHARETRVVHATRHRMNGYPMPENELLSAFERSLPSDFWSAPRVLVAVSGGSDSLALLHLLSRCRDQRQADSHSGRLPITVVHFDHQWHDASDAIGRQVAELAAQHACDFLPQTSADLIQELSTSDKHATAIAAIHGHPPRLPDLGLEGTSRFLRYEFFQRAASATGAKFLLTGHTWNDQVETVLMRIGRGTGLDGLAGISPRRSLSASCELLRPLLHFTRQQLQTEVQQHNLRYWVDPSNEDQDRTRNRVRHAVLPWLRENFSPEIDRSLARLANAAAEQNVAWEHLSQVYASALLVLEEDRLEVNVRALKEVPEAIVRGVLVFWWKQTQLPLAEMNFQHWMRLTRLAVRTGRVADDDASTNQNPIDDNAHREDGIPISHAAPSAWPAEFHFPGPVQARRSGGILRISRIP